LVQLVRAGCCGALPSIHQQELENGLNKLWVSGTPLWLNKSAKEVVNVAVQQYGLTFDDGVMQAAGLMADATVSPFESFPICKCSFFGLHLAHAQRMCKRLNPLLSKNLQSCHCVHHFTKSALVLEPASFQAKVMPPCLNSDVIIMHVRCTPLARPNSCLAMLLL
jgi:hypothetical protein